MSDREFENYLALLARLLRLSGKHKDQIARELRAHMEDRLEELIASGASKEDAVRRALEEFGDAAGLAADFVSLSRTRKRRWLVKMTTYSVAATVLLAAGLALVWPGRNAGPGAALVVAQGPKAGQPAAPADPFAAPAQAGKAEDEAKPLPPGKIESELSKPTNIEFVELPLKDAFAYLSDMHGIPFVLKVKKMEEASISPDTPITKNLKGVRLSTALNLILEELELTYIEQEEFILITTPEDAKTTLEIRVYQCRDLLAMNPDIAPAERLPSATGFGSAGEGGGGFGAASAPGEAASERGTVGGSFGGSSRESQRQERAQRLMDLITTNVDQQSWTQVGGAGSVSEYNGMIVVTQTAQTHRKIERVLSMLREAAGLDPAKAGKVVK